ncbi:MAG: ribosome-associated translation inhibitor RaiA [Chitinivibrionales bacterium]|nr:ribosome-associated translation inhibitor RaiA [Chitinivibrionales bacterium]
MNVQITSRHNKVSQDTHDFLKNELMDLEKFYDKMTSCHVILDAEHVFKTVDITINIKGKTVNASAKAENLGKAVNDSLEKIKQQLKKFNQKVKNHKKTALNEIIEEPATEPVEETEV